MGCGILSKGNVRKSGLQHPGLLTLINALDIGSYSNRAPSGDLTSTSFMSLGSIPWLRYNSGSVVGPDRSAIRSEVILLGKYSLFGYISQVAILQLLSKGYQHVDLGAARLPGSFFAAVVLTILAVEILDRARARSRGSDRLYKAIFA